MKSAPGLLKQEGGREKDREKERYSSGVVKKSLRPPCAPESTLYKKIQRYFHWVNDPSLISTDLSAYKEVVSKLHAELLELEMESIRWAANVNTVRAEFSNMESSLSTQVVEQEELESELSSLLLREVAALEELTQGVSHGTRGKASLTMEDVANRMVNFDTVLRGQLEACLGYAQKNEKTCSGSVTSVADPQTGEVLVCSYRPDTSATASESTQIMLNSADNSSKMEVEVVEEKPKIPGPHDQIAAVTAAIDAVINDKVPSQQSLDIKNEVDTKNTSKEGVSGLKVSTSFEQQELPELSAIVACIEGRKRKILEMSPSEIFSETSTSRSYPSTLPDDMERNNNYFKLKRTQGLAQASAERQRCEVESIAAAGKYSCTPLAEYIEILQRPYKTGALEGLGLRSIEPPSVSSSGTPASKGRGRGGKLASNGDTVAMHMNALRRTPCDVPLFLSPFSSLEGWYGGTYEALEFPLSVKGNSGVVSTSGLYNIENQEHFTHPKFIQAGEKIMSMINTLSGATQRALIELADLEKEESEWKSQVTSSSLAQLKAEEALGAVLEGSRGQIRSWVGTADPGSDGVNGTLAGAAAGASSSEREGLLGLIGMGVANGGNGDLNGSTAKKLADNKKSAAKKKAAARRRR
jgi:hypothetical protein